MAWTPSYPRISRILASLLLWTLWPLVPFLIACRGLFCRSLNLLDRRTSCWNIRPLYNSSWEGRFKSLGRKLRRSSTDGSILVKCLRSLCRWKAYSRLIPSPRRLVAQTSSTCTFSSDWLVSFWANCAHLSTINLIETGVSPHKIL